MKLSIVLNDRTSHFILIHTWILSFVFYLDTYLKLPSGPFGPLSNICISAYLVAPFLILILAPNWKQAIRQVFLASLADVHFGFCTLATPRRKLEVGLPKNQKTKFKIKRLK